jgi:hypothetical protein
MSFLDTVRRAGTYLQEQGRVSLRALSLEFGLDDESLEALVEELVDVQQVAAREGKVVVWVATTRSAETPPRPNGASSPCSSATWSTRPGSARRWTPRSGARW